MGRASNVGSLRDLRKMGTVFSILRRTEQDTSSQLADIDSKLKAIRDKRESVLRRKEALYTKTRKYGLVFTLWMSQRNFLDLACFRFCWWVSTWRFPTTASSASSKSCSSSSFTLLRCSCCVNFGSITMIDAWQRPMVRLNRLRRKKRDFWRVWWRR